ARRGRRVERVATAGTAPGCRALARAAPDDPRMTSLSAPLGRFLEISIGTRVIRESLEFYEALGFVQAAVSETWSHPYAVVTDGHLFIGLHGREMPSPSLTF